MRRHRRSPLIKLLVISILGLVLVTGAMLAVHYWESKTAVEVQNAGQQMTSTSSATTAEGAQVFLNGQWYAPRKVETMLLIGIDNFGGVTQSGSYNNASQADFLALYIHDEDTDKGSVIHLNRDTITDITVLGVTGQNAGTRRAQLALAYNYGSGGTVSSQNTVDAVSRLLYGMEIDHYLTVSMDAIPLLNDWAGGVTIEVQDDFSGVDDKLVKGQKTTLIGQQALTYVRTRYGMDDSSNLQRMTRQRQYAAEWIKTARPLLNDQNAVAELVFSLKDYHSSDCTADKLNEFARMLGNNETIQIHELPGEAKVGQHYMEYYVDDSSIQRLVLELFYTPVGE